MQLKPCCVVNKVTFKLEDYLNDTLYYIHVQGRIDSKVKNRKLHKFATTNNNFRKK